MKISLLIGLFSFLCYFPVISQETVTYGEINEIGNNRYQISSVDFGLHNIDFDKDIQMQAGFLLSFADSMLSQGTTVFQGDSVVWTSVFHNPQHLGLIWYFRKNSSGNRFRVELGSAHSGKITAMFSDAEEGDYRVLGPFYGDSALIRVSWFGASGMSAISLLNIGLIGHPDHDRNFGSSGSCNVNVNCSEGSGWQNQRRGIVRILVKQGSALFWCSGSLVNNVRQDKTPYVLTANHCGIQSSFEDYLQWVYYFNYESSSCIDPVIEPVYQSLTGSQLVAASQNDVETGSDFRLVLLNQSIPESFNVFYNGWNRSENVTNSGVCIHHPSGDIKKVSTYSDAPVSTGFGQQNTDPAGRYWRVNWVETENGHGVTEGGSSGSPLFDASGRIIGALTGGNASCGNLLAPDYYGKFSFSWEQNGIQTDKQLKPWLDPDQTGLIQLNGLSDGTEPLIAIFSADHTEVISGQSVRFVDQSAGSITDFKWYFEGGRPETSTQQNPVDVFYGTLGEFDVTLVVNNEVAKDSLVRKSMIKVLPLVIPNPGSNSFDVFTGAEQPDAFEVRLFDSAGRELGYSRTNDPAGYINLSVHTNFRGMILIMLNREGKRLLVKHLIAQ
jgi:PKD repeat protein